MPVLDSIILFACGLSIVMSLGLIVRRLYFRNVVLSVILGLMGYITFSIYLLHSGKVYDFPFFFFSQVPVVMTLSPLLYFYILSITGDKERFSRRDILHFVPVILVGLYLLPYYLYSSNAQSQIIYELLNENRHLMLRAIVSGAVIMPAIYIGAPIVRIILHIRRGNPAETKIILLLSLLILWLITGIVGIGGTIALSFPVLKIINLIVGIVILCFYLLGQRYPYLLQYGTVHMKSESYSKSHLNGLDLDNLSKQLVIIMEQEKFYCDEDLSLSRLSKALGITSHQLSQFLNKHFNKNFNNFVNSYRIEDAKKLLVDEPDRNTLSIALSVGFNSYSAFHSAFKKSTSLSPAEFRREKTRHNIKKNR